ncbi:phospholipid-transporting ATPase IH [Lepeophtheirus salmonis]|uniref:phospholipid-transporting ATPase IH n=1 Tax=Lepeophtheirus salmonis TaxID=72036 RepID=UPI001AE9F47B|nr:probable phospholipid-transporting ATPase IH [Lepeophtheirus salmonis]
MASTQLKNTKEVLGLCVFTGSQTKMSLNSRITKNKFSVVERTLNKFLIFYGVIMLLQILISTILTMHFGFEYSTVRDKLYTQYKIYFEDTANEWYIGQVLDVDFMAWIITSLIWFTLFNFYIPISLYITLECQKMISSRLYRRDMIYYDSNVLCNTSDVNEDLGLVTHLFTDKTGTLTTNVMTFRKYVDENCRVGLSLKEEEGIWSPFLMILTMCHSAQIDSDNFVASSPDEKALLEACRKGGYNYLGETNDGIISIQTKDRKIRNYRKLDELEFDSFRKSMSVIVQCEETSKIFVLTKGAETTMAESISSNYSDLSRSLVDEFAEEGLRTLVLGYRTLTEDEYTSFNAKAEVARSAVIESNRTKFVREAYSLVENNLSFAGITGIEDKLQEDLQETLEALREAGIMICMLTGDKKETAVNIAQSCGLIPRGSQIIEICNVSIERDMNILISSVYDRQRNDTLERSGVNTILVVDGKLLSYIFKNENCKNKFSYVLGTVTSVIACRLSPIQKSLLVRMVKKIDTKNFVTAAIGDGGNDISMIQEAHVGFGIIGLEGKGAARAADFAFSKFKFLRRTLLVHGYWFYDRVAYVVQYSFYKNIVCFFCQFLIAFYSNFSATSLYSGTFLTCFNTIYTSVPVLIFGLFERRESEETLWNNPGIYQRNVGNKQLKAVKLVSWFCLGLWQAVVIFFGWLLAWPTMNSMGLGDLFCMGTVIGESTILVTNYQILFDAKYFDPKLVLSIVLSLFGYGIVTFILQKGFIPFFEESNEFGVYELLFLSLPKWAISILLVLSCLLPKFFVRSAYYFLVANEDAIKSKIKKTVRFDLSMNKL